MSIETVWEFPGGKLDQTDEGVWEGALREWEEETGSALGDDAEHVGSFLSPDGVYQAFVIRVPREADLSFDIQTEEIADIGWWDPADLPNNEQIRDKVAESLPLLQRFLLPGVAKASDGGPHVGSGMVSLDLPAGTLPSPNGGVSDQHITIVFFGKDVDDATFDAVCERAAGVAASMAPPSGSVGGLGSFPPSESSDWLTPVFAIPDVPAAAVLRTQFEDFNASEHKDFKPHVTLAYLADGEAMPDPIPETAVSFSHLSVDRGDDVRRFPFGTGVAKAAASPKLAAYHRHTDAIVGYYQHEIASAFEDLFPENALREVIEDARTAAPLAGVAKFSDEQPRDDDGRFASGGGSTGGSSTPQSLGDVIQQHPNVQIEAHENSAGIHLSLIRTEGENRGTGAARAAMQSLTSYADHSGQAIGLTPDAIGHGGLSTSQLKQWYGSFGFVRNTGRNADYAISESYVRQPSTASKAVAKTAPQVLAATAVAALRRRLGAVGQLTQVFRSMWGDAALQATHTASEQLGAVMGGTYASLTQELPADYWSNWTPGWGDAAAQLADGGMRDMLDQAGITIQSVVDSRLDDLGNVIATGVADGDSVDSIARDAQGLLSDPSRAFLIADTEVARGMSTQALQDYQGSGVQMVDWLAEADACPECEDLADNGPYPVDALPDTVPQHPRCRCSWSPVVDVPSGDEGDQ